MAITTLRPRLSLSHKPGDVSAASLSERSSRPFANEHDAGFTLLEILVVITIIGLLVGLVAPAALRQLDGARVSLAKQSIERLDTILDMYKLDIGSYPVGSDGLQALVEKPTDVTNWSGPYLKGNAELLDPWSHPYLYRMPSQRGGHDYDICSRGPNADSSQGMICNQ